MKIPKRVWIVVHEGHDSLRGIEGFRTKIDAHLDMTAWCGRLAYTSCRIVSYRREPSSAKKKMTKETK